MSHNIHYDTCKDTKVEKEACESYWNEYAERESWAEGGHGLSSPIRWIDHICDSYAEAKDFIEKEDNGWYDQLAVKFREYKQLETNKTYEVLKERKERLYNRYIELKTNIHYEGVKSSFVSCKNCGSKFASQYFGKSLNNICPVCKKDLRPESTLTLIENAKKNAEKANKAFEEEEKKLQKKQLDKATIMWLVKVEYHT